MSISFEALPARLRALGLERYAASIVAAARPSLALTLTASDDRDIPLGASKFGGKPDLATGAAWPMTAYADADRPPAPLLFLAQFDLAEVASFGAATLPESGTLAFFYDDLEQPWGFAPAHRGGWKIVHTPAGSVLERRSAPARDADLAADGVAPARVAFVPFASFPYQQAYQDPNDVAQWWDPIAAGFSVDASDRAKLPELYALPMRVGHRLFGHPDLIQNPMELECELVSRGYDTGHGNPQDAANFEDAAREWRLLLQVDTFDRCEWGDSGIVYFWIRERDLAAGAFERAWCILQCC